MIISYVGDKVSMSNNNDIRRAWCLIRVQFEFGIMGGDKRCRAFVAQITGDRLGNGCAFGRIGAGA